MPGRLDTPTGGYNYDRRIVAGLRALGWAVTVRELDESFPFPTPLGLDHAAAVLAAVPDGELVLIDGLAGGALAEQMHCEAARLRLVALVHHPLAAETGLPLDVAIRIGQGERQALASARTVVVTSRATAAALASYGVPPDRVAVVEPGTAAAPLAAGSGSRMTELLCVGTLTPRKGHAALVRALAALAHLPWHLTCVGSVNRDRATADRLRLQLRESGLDDRVSLTGDLDDEGVALRYSRSDVFVLATEYEGYGMAVAEALARGIPVVSTATGAIPDLVQGGAGVVVPPGDTTALTLALEQVLGDAALRLRLAEGARVVRTRLPTWDAASARMADVLQRVGAR